MTHRRPSTVAVVALSALLLAALLGLLALGPAVAPADAAPRAQAAKTKPLRIVFLRCSSDPYPCRSHRHFTRTGKMLVGASGLTRQARVEFPVRTKGGRSLRRRIAGVLRTPTRLVVRVPGDAVTGRIRVVVPGRSSSNYVRITVVRAPRAVQQRGNPAPASRPLPRHPSVFDGDGMWIWYLSRSHGGDPARIAEQARAHGIETIYVKSADGASVWSQFSATAVAALKATGLRVCGWQFVYGNDPLGEARAAAAAKDVGADCFVIDAEGAYEGKYAQAQRYVTALRERVGDDFPIALTSFPYVHYHPGFPYSVFMGPGGATANLPQVYWKTIGDSVDESLAITYRHNVLYKTPIFPLGQTYDGPAAADIRRFRQLSTAYGARGVSWWVWQYASASDWTAVGADVPAIAAPPAAGYPTLRAGANGRVGSRGDLVVWAQQHLAGAGQPVAVDGAYGRGTADAVRAYQESKGLPATGVLDDATWPALLEEPMQPRDWTARAGTARAARASAAGEAAPNGPVSAGLPAVRYEIPPGPRR